MPSSLPRSFFSVLPSLSPLMPDARWIKLNAIIVRNYPLPPLARNDTGASSEKRGAAITQFHRRIAVVEALRMGRPSSRLVTSERHARTGVLAVGRCFMTHAVVDGDDDGDIVNRCRRPSPADRKEERARAFSACGPPTLTRELLLG